MHALLFDQPDTEVVDLEWKKGGGGLPSSLWETFSAMANTHGGVIEVGIDDDGNPIGLKKPEARRKDFFDTVNNPQKVSARLVNDSDVSIETKEGKAILRIRVPRASRHDRPVYLNNNPMTGTYRRAGEGDYRCSEEEVKRMFADQSGRDSGGDGRRLKGFTIDDLDHESIAQYRNRVSARAPEHPVIQADVAEMLRKIGALHYDRTTFEIGATMAGLMMFGRSEAIQDPDAVPSFHLDYREAGDLPGDRYKDRVTIDGTWAGNLFQFYQRIVPRLEADLKVPFSLDRNGVRRDTTPQQEAIREALVNSLIHADHRGGGGVVVEKSRDKLSFGNPGMLLVSREQFFLGGVSECRNPSLQRMFQLLGLGEKAGSGIDVIRRGWRAQAWRTPLMVETTRPDRVQLIMPMVSLMPENVVADLRRQFGGAFEGLSEPAAQAVVTACVEGAVTNARLCEITEIHPADATRLFQKLVGDGILASEGYGRGMIYRPVEAELQLSGLDRSQGDLARSLQDHRASSLQPQLDDVERQILSATMNKWCTSKELAHILDRSSTDLRARYLGRMVNLGLLRLRYPDKPTHPHQAYSAADSRTTQMDVWKFAAT